MQMNEAARVAKSRYEEIANRLSQPDAAADTNRYAALMREYKELEPIAECAEKVMQAESAIAEAQELLSDNSIDEEFKLMAQEQLDENKEKLVPLTEELQLLLLPKDPNDKQPAIVEIRAGTGGEEAALFAYDLYRMYTMYAQKRGWKIEPLGANETELGGYKEISFMLEGDAPYSRMKFESGVHRVQRVPETETQGRIQTSAATVAVLPEAEEVTVEINQNDLRIDTFRSGGAGGQHINKTESAIRITHLPTGLVVECQDERSQYKNKDKAMRVLRSRLMDMMQSQQNAEIASQRKSLVGSGDRSERIRTYNFPQGRVTDHRIGLTVYRIDSVMNGDLDEFIDALSAKERADMLLELSEGTR